MPIAELLEENIVEHTKFYAKSPLTTFYDEEGVVRMVTKLPVSFCNLLAGAKLSNMNITNSLNNALKPFNKNKVPLRWWVGPNSYPKDLGKHLEKIGLKKIFDMAGMVFQLKNLEKRYRTPSNFKYEVVTNDSLLVLWAKTQTKAFQGRNELIQYIIQFEKSLGTNEDSPWVRYIGFIDKEPVTVSILFKGRNIASVHNVATIPEFRRKRLGTIMTKIPMFAARDAGYGEIVLKATPKGENLYRAMNFQKCCNIELYYRQS
ncbi:MAG: hypothetical protein ACXAC6_03035 [Candidatus Hodarchaeales archaeon]